ncbi:MAG: flavin reductase [Ruminococcus sp.]|nr:flavin reductase [Ruminococcus sp.]
MDLKAMNRISYGLYVLTAANGSFSNGCIINTLAQVTSSPNRVSITVNKANYTCFMIRASGKFNVSMIDTTADFSLFTHFGFSSGRWEDKFFDFPFARAGNGVPYITEHTCAYLSGEVVQEIDLGTHIMFIADVTAAEVLSDKEAMTYAYYHANVKPKPAAAPAAAEGSGERWICNICGYIYEGHLPEDFICPLCKHGAADFSRLDGEAPAKEDAAPEAGGEEKWICSVCGYVFEGSLPEDYVCPICGVGADEFNRM